MGRKTSLTKNYFIKTLALVLILSSLFIVLGVFSNKGIDLRITAKKATTQCEDLGAFCVNEKSCLARGGLKLEKQDCSGNSICCLFDKDIITPTPLPRLEYQGTNIKVITECAVNGMINIYIIDDGVDERPNGTWVYLIVPSGDYSYLAYSSPDNLNSSASIYGVTNPIRGSVREQIQSLTTYTAGIAHGSYTSTTPTLEDPRYELDFQTPNCQ